MQTDRPKTESDALFPFFQTSAQNRERKQKSDSAMDKIEEHFYRTRDKTGISLDAAQLISWAKTQGLYKASTRGEVFRFLRESSRVDQGAFARPLPVKDYQTVSPLRPGVFFIDYGEFHKSWSGSNGGATGFLVAVENVTCKLFVLPTRGKGTAQWLESIEKFVELSRQVSVIYSDRDTVAQSARFRTDLMERFGIRWHFLRSRHKSFLAERFIGYVKKKLSQALEHAQRRSGKGTPVKRWVDYVEPLVKIYNDQKVEGTRYRRRTVSRENFNDLLAQLFGNDKNYDLRFNSFAVGEFSHRANWNAKLFKFSLGDQVRINRRADWADPENRLGFVKASTRGSFGRRIYKVVGRQLRWNKAYTKLIPIYALDGLPPGGGFTFYESDLVRVSDDR